VGASPPPWPVAGIALLFSSSSSSSSSLARQPFVSPGLHHNYSPFFPIVGASGYSFFGFLNNLILTV
jgi:hypothetical protein